MRSYLTAAILGIGTFCAPATADASWLSEALRNTHVHVVAPVYHPAYVPAPVYGYPPPCARPAYVAPVYEPECHHVRPAYPAPYRRGHHGHHGHYHR